MIQTKETDALTDASNIEHLAEVDGVIEAYLIALNAVVCDDETILITLPVVWSLDETVQGMGLAVAALGSLYTMSLMVLTVVFRKAPQIRAASPVFMIISLLGVQFLFGAVVALVSPVSKASCSTLSALVNLGITLTFGPLAAKTWRLNKIFNRSKLSVFRCSNRKLMMIIVAQIAVELTLLIPWQIISPFEPITREVIQGSGRVHQYSQCWVQEEGLTFFYIAAIMKGILIVYMAMLAFTTRKITGHFNESSQIAMVIYNFLFIIALIVGIIMVIDAVGDIQVGLLLFVGLWISFFSATMISVPKFFQIINQAQDDAAPVSMVGSHGNSTSGFSFVSLDQLETLPVLTQYFAALKHHSEMVENKIATLKRGKNGAAASHANGVRASHASSARQ